MTRITFDELGINEKEAVLMYQDGRDVREIIKVTRVDSGRLRRLLRLVMAERRMKI